MFGIKKLKALVKQLSERVAELEAKPPVSTNPLDLGNGFQVSSVDEGMYKKAEFVIPLGGFYSFTYNGVEVYRIDQNGGRNI